MNNQPTKTHDIWTELRTIKTRTLKEIGDGGTSNADLRILTAWLQRALNLEDRYKDLVGEAERLLTDRQKRGANALGNAPLENGSSDMESSLTRKKRAELFREAYLERARGRGQHLVNTGGIYYRNDEGVLVGITFASKTKRGSWFLGLTDGEFQEAVLLCQTGKSAACIVHLPQSFISEHERLFSKSSDGAVKFNLANRNDKLSLQVPKMPLIDIDRYVESEPLTVGGKLSAKKPNR